MKKPTYLMPDRGIERKRESSRRATAKMYAARRERGLCINCGTAHAPLGKVMGFACRDRQSGYNRKAYAKAKDDA